MDETATSVKDRSTWLSLLAGVVIWFLHLNTINALTSLTCEWGWFPFTIAGIAGLRFIHIVVSLIAALGIAAIIVLSWRGWRNWQAAQADAQHTLVQTGADRHPLMAFVTMLLNGLFLVYVLASLVMVLVLNPCV